MQRMLSRKISEETLAKFVIQPMPATSSNCVPIEPPPTWKLTDMPASWAAAHSGSQCRWASGGWPKSDGWLQKFTARWPASLAAVQLGDGEVDVPERQGRDGDEPVGGDARPVGEEVVVGPDAVEREVALRRESGEVAVPEATHVRVQHLGVDPLLVEERDPLLGVVHGRGDLVVGRRHLRRQHAVVAGHRVVAGRAEELAVGHPDVAAVLALDVGHAVVQRGGHAGGPHVGRLGQVGVDVDDVVAVEQVGHGCSSSDADGSVGDGAVVVEAGDLVVGQAEQVAEDLVGVLAERRAPGVRTQSSTPVRPERLGRHRRRTGHRMVHDLLVAPGPELGMAVREAGVVGRRGRDAERRRARRRPSATSCVAAHAASTSSSSSWRARRPSTVARPGSAARSGRSSTFVGQRPPTGRRRRPSAPARRRRRRTGRRPAARRRGCGCRPARAGGRWCSTRRSASDGERQGGVEQRALDEAALAVRCPARASADQEADQRRAGRRWDRSARAGCGAGRRGGR